MHAFIEAVLSRTRTVLSILLFLFVAGIITYNNIPKESDPDVEIPVIYVSIPHDGISPQDAERLLLRPMEQELQGLEGIKEMTATASEGHGSVVLEFIVGVDIDQALSDVRAKVDQAKPKLPAGGDEPEVHQVTLATEQPAITVLLSGDLPQRALLTIARDLQDQMETMKQVLEVNIGGDREDFLEITVNPLLMESYGLDQADIYNLVSRNNRLVTAGTLDTGNGRFAVKVPAVFENVKDVIELPIKVDGDRIVTFGDVASARRTFKDASTYARVNGKPTISLEVSKRPGENLIETIEQVKTLIAQEQAFWPDSVIIDYAGDKSKDIRTMLSELQNNILSAVLLVVVVIIAVMGVRSSLLVGIAIPGSFLAGILMLSLGGLTINMVVLFSLIMAVGMLVDGAIVVTEFADRQMSEGVPRHQAYSLASQRMSWPIIASTATTLAAFAPLLAWPGMVGQFMGYLPLTLIATLSASLVMALIFVPSLGNIFGRPRKLTAKQQQALIKADKGEWQGLDGFTGVYLRVLHKAVNAPLRVLGLGIVIAIAVIMAYSSAGKGVEFFPEVEPVGYNIIVRSHGDYSTDEKLQVMLEVERRIIDLEDYDTLYTKVGGDQLGDIRVNLKDWNERRPANEIIEDMRSRLAPIAGLEIEFRKDKAGPPAGKDLQLELSSRFPERLEPMAKKIRELVNDNPHFVNAEDSTTKPGIEWQLKVDRAKAARFGADVTLLGNTVQFVTNGLNIGDYRPDDVDDELEIRVRFPEENRSISRLSELRVKTAYGLVPITNFVSLEAKPKQDVINKVDGRQVLTVSADVAAGQNLSIELPKIQEQLKQLELDPLVDIKLRGQNEDQQESMAFLGRAFMVALFVMGLILITQFNSFYQALLILSAVLFSTIGVLLGLLIAGQAFGIIMSGLGVITLAGIVVNNNIVLIDTYNVLRRQGIAAQEAIMRTGAQRLRPVMLTTITTILGLMPMVLELNIDVFERSFEVGAPSSQWWSQLATAVAGGLSFATLLTLILTPCLLMLGAKFSRKDKQAAIEEAKEQELLGA
ncbi:AcrB/AcrD/AcrF family protein [Agarivorans sp. B2Z047]|uniref:efflux RND transporter permease subunit n=1 Tax=Agarivorans sp. B2Z047 TaxID=2652721 RepID=UPI00128C6703|nr:efflux RND transporter permease subunit [Agarivorans sp. B2Z047]MPW30501.1 AcrB/AcrD/AcrF family protein [Agarivorans sp. B2Z047]UQN42278.1 efflux RND transporter permease subunit [Agarivorans sp. B2Z047]